jgi:hypothetical protein
MKARRKIKLLSLAVMIIMIASANVSFSQDEYDDMYFNSADRKEVKFNENAVKPSAVSSKADSKAMAKNTTNTDVINPAYSPTEYGDLEESYSARTVNPEYIERYKDNPKGTTGTAEVAEGDSYYDDYYERAVMPGEIEKGSEKVNYPYPSSYYGGYNAAMRTRMYRNPWYDPFYGGGFAPGFSMGLGYSFGMMPGFSMSFGYGSGMGYGGYNPYGFYDPFSPWGYDPFSPWGYDPFYSPYGYNSMYRNSMMYGYGGPGYCPYPSYGFGSGYGTSYGGVPVSTGVKSSNTGTVAESNTLRSPSYRTRASRGSDQATAVAQDVPNTRRALATRSTTNDRVSSANARVADRDFSRSQNEYYSRSGSRNATSTVSSGSNVRNTAYTSSRNMGSSVSNTSAARVRSTRSNSTYSRPSYKSSREQRSINSGSSGRSWNSGTYRSSRSSGSSYTPASRTSSSYSGSSGSSFRSSSSGGSSSGSISSGGGSRSSGSSGGGSRSGRGN